MDSVEKNMTNFASVILRCTGPVLVISLYLILSFHVYCFFGFIAPLLKKRLGTEFGLVWIAIGLSLLYNIVYNHLLAVCIKPSGPKDLKLIETMREQVKGRANRKSVSKNLEDDRFEGLSSDVKRLLRYRSKTMKDLETFWTKKCYRCNEIKPARTHHCSICNSCVFVMDHHCPWINNCLGLENYRYFLLFIFYLWAGLIFMAITIMSISNHHDYKINKFELSFCLILDFVLGIVLVFFNGWNWYLAFTGNSTIEFWSDEKNQA